MAARFLKLIMSTVYWRVVMDKIPYQEIDFLIPVHRFKINFSELISNILLYPKYLSFFNNKNNIHYIEKIGLQSKNEVTLRDCIQNKHIQAPIFLKIDIEGGEYRVLDELVEYSSMICGLAIEFHDVDLHQDRIELFLNEFPLTLVHTHPNNFGGVDKKGDPLVLEMSFSDSPDVTGDTPLYQYDQPNNPNIDELKLIV